MIVYGSFLSCRGTYCEFNAVERNFASVISIFSGLPGEKTEITAATYCEVVKIKLKVPTIRVFLNSDFQHTKMNTLNFRRNFLVLKNSLKNLITAANYGYLSYQEDYNNRYR